MELAGWTRPDRGVAFVVSGPSGVGKSTLVHRALARIPDLAFSVSATTRAPRRGEVDGVHYHFLGTERFDALVSADAFLEHATVYGRRYGTLRAPTERALAEGSSVIMDVDLRGALQVRDRLPEAVHVFVLPPDLATLEARLRARGTDEPEVIERRLVLAGEQLAGCATYDYVVVNDVLDTADRVFTGILLAELSRTSRRARLVERIGAAQPRDEQGTTEDTEGSSPR